jgi:hypothetical protein
MCGLGRHHATDFAIVLSKFGGGIKPMSWYSQRITHQHPVQTGCNTILFWNTVIAHQLYGFGRHDRGRWAEEKKSCRPSGCLESIGGR